MMSNSRQILHKIFHVLCPWFLFDMQHPTTRWRQESLIKPVDSCRLCKEQKYTSTYFLHFFSCTLSHCCECCFSCCPYPEVKQDTISGLHILGLSLGVFPGLIHTTCHFCFQVCFKFRPAENCEELLFSL